ncbi:MAG: hypothetical protein EOO77_33015 [Oxalobacteraceae bacterium]|nr:MAG: hypothetical protein EOO77_33015 [Oxalobacteraceae bacterium]
MDAPNEYANAASSTAELAKEQGRSLASLSTMIGRNAAYLKRFVTRGSPRLAPRRALRRALPRSSSQCRPA